MWVVIDRDDLGGVHGIDTDPAAWFEVQHPNGSGLTGIDQVLIWHNTHFDDRDKAGWNVTNKLSGETELLTRWQRLVRACNGPDATEQARSLGLTE
jgi:hypothetical protein